MNFAENSRTLVRWGLYPTLWALLAFIYLGLHGETIGARQSWGLIVGILLTSLLILEQLVPYEKRWAMTWRSFLDDTKYLIINGGTLGLFSAFLALFAITISGDLTGPASNWPFWLQLSAILIGFEIVQYSIHRVQHEMKGRFGSFMWRTHVAHHLPERLYIAMHVAGHPINAILTQGAAIIVPIWLMGYDQSVVTLFLMINTMHGLISHFNVDMRMGWVNYIFVGPELHRYHHSANLDESKNYGATISLLDQIFGTFVYNPGTPPARLGVHKPDAYPVYGEVRKVMGLPLKSE